MLRTENRKQIFNYQTYFRIFYFREEKNIFKNNYQTCPNVSINEHILRSLQKKCALLLLFLLFLFLLFTLTVFVFCCF